MTSKNTVDVFVSASHVLTDQQSHWVKTVTERVYCLLKETPPDGETFAKTTRVRMNGAVFGPIVKSIFFSIF